MLREDLIDAILAVTEKPAGIGGAMNARSTAAKKPSRKKPPKAKTGIGGAADARAKSDELEQERLKAALIAQLTRSLGDGGGLAGIGKAAYGMTPLGVVTESIREAVRAPSLSSIGRAAGNVATGGAYDLSVRPIALSAANVGRGDPSWMDALMLGSLLPVLRGPQAIARALGVGLRGQGGRAAARAAAEALTYKVPGPLRAGARKGGKVGAAEKAARQATPETEEVVGAMKKGRVAAKEQRKIYSEERGKRVGEAQQALSEAGGGLAGRKAALEKLKGELPKVHFGALTHLDDEAMEKLARIIQRHSGLGFWDQRSLEGALIRMRQGMAPRPFEIKLIEEAFGAEKALEAGGVGSLGRLMTTAVGEVANAPRSLMTFLDVSAFLRQALLAAAAQPKIWARGLKPSFHMLFSEKYYQERMLALANRRSFGDMMEAGVQLTELGKISKREEQFASNLIEKLTGGKYSPVRASGRSYVGFLNETRADLFDYYVAITKAEGINTPERRHNIAKMVNTFTGRGKLISKLEPAADVLNWAMFSSRLFASRVNAISPVFYYKLDPWTRRQMLKAMIRLIGAGTTTLTLAALAGAKVGLDPRSSDFGKIRLGNTRFDVWGGYQQVVKVIYQAASGETISPVTGEKTKLTGGFLSRRDPFTRFFEAKLAPTPSLINDWGRGRDFLGKPFSWKKAMVDRSYPILVQDVLDVQREESEWWKSVGVYGIGATGISVQTFGPREKPKTAKRLLGRKPVTSDEYRHWQTESVPGGGDEYQYWGTP